VFGYKGIRNLGQCTDNNVTTLPSTPKPQTSKEVIAANVQLLIEQLEAGHSEGLTSMLLGERLWRDDFRYSKCGVMITELLPEMVRQAGTLG
jgi:hypothetical protein